MVHGLSWMRGARSGEPREEKEIHLIVRASPEQGLHFVAIQDQTFLEMPTSLPCVWPKAKKQQLRKQASKA